MQAADNSANATPPRRPARLWRTGLLGVLVLLGGTLASAAWYFSDSNRVRALTERAVTALTGRQLTISGEFAFSIGREISISGKQISWANAPWSSNATMLSADSAEVAVDLRSILQPPVLITRVAADGAQFRFEWNDEGVSNWLLVDPQNAPAQNPPQTRQPLQWRLLQAQLKNAEVFLRPAAGQEELRITAQELQQQQDDTAWESGLPMTVRATALNWANPGWASQAAMLDIAAAEGTFDFVSILEPPLLIRNLTARDAQVDFEWDTEGRFNWRLGPGSDDESEHPFPWLLDKANLQNFALRFKHPAQTEALLIDVSSATQQQDESQRLVTNLDGTIAGQPLNLDGRIGPFPQLLAAGAVDFDLTLKDPHSTLTLQGDVVRLATLQKPSLKLKWIAPDVEKFFAMFNIRSAAKGAANLQGSVTPVGEGIEAQIDGTVGEFAVNGSLRTESVNQLEGLSIDQLNGLTVKFQSSGPSARAAGLLLALDGLPPEPYELDVQVQDAANGLEIEALRFTTAGAVATGTGLFHDFPKLDRLDFDLQMNVPNIARFRGLLPGQQIPALPFSLDGKIRSNSDDTNDSVTASLKLGSMQAGLSGLLTENPRFAGSNFDWTLAVPDAQRTAAIFDVKLLSRIALNATGKATISENSLGLQEARVTIGPHTARLNATLPLSAEDQPIALSGNLQGPSLGALINLFTPTDQVPSLAYNINGQYRYRDSILTLGALTGTLGSNEVEATGPVVFGNDWRGTNLQLSARGPHLEELVPANTLNEIPTGSFTASAGLKLAAGSTTLSQLNMQTETGRVTGSLNLGWPADPERIDFDLSASGENLRMIMPDFEGYEAAAVPYEIKAIGKFREQQADFTQLLATLGSIRLELQGNLDFRAAVRSDGAVLKASGKQLSDLGTLRAWSPPDEAFDLTATMTGAANALNVSDFQLTYGPSDLRGSMRLRTGGRPRIDIVGQSSQLDIRRFEPEEYGSPSTAATKTDRRIPDQPLPVDLLNALNGSLQLDAKKFISRRLLFEKLQVDATLAEGNLTLDGDSDFSNGGTAKITLQMLQRPNNALHSELAVTARNISFELNQLDPSLQGKNPFQNIDAYLTGNGTNLRDLAASLDGFFWLRGGGQQIATRQFRFLFGDVLTGVLEAINPFARREPYQTIQCVMAFFEASNGVLQTAPALLMSTDRLNVGATGSVNLANERIALNVNADPRTGVGISASSILNPFVALRGTLADPQLSLDPSGTLIQGGAAVATGGLSLIANSLFRRWFGSRQPCVTLVDEARKIQQKRNPATVPAD